MVEIMTMQHRQVSAHYAYIKILLHLTSVTVIGPLLSALCQPHPRAVVQSTSYRHIVIHNIITSMFFLTGPRLCFGKRSCPWPRSSPSRNEEEGQKLLHPHLQCLPWVRENRSQLIILLQVGRGEGETGKVWTRIHQSQSSKDRWAQKRGTKSKIFLTFPKSSYKKNGLFS